MKTIISIQFVLCLLFGSTGIKAQDKVSYVELSGSADFLNAGDTVQFRLYRHPNTYHEPELRTEIKQKVKGKHFEFRLPCTDFPHYFNLSFKGHPGRSLNAYYVVPGQPLELHFSIDGFDSKGSSAVAAVQADIIKAQQVPSMAADDGNNGGKLTRHLNRIMLDQLHVLESYREKLPLDFYKFLRLDIFASNIWTKYSDIERMSSIYADSAKNTYYEEYLQTPDTASQMLANAIKEYPENWQSEACLQSILKTYSIDSCIAVRKPYQVEKCYDYLKNNYSGKLREELIAALILRLDDYPAGLQRCIVDAMNFLTDPDYRTLMQHILDGRVDGAMAYNFRLPDQQGQMRRLSDFKSKVILIDFWFTGCGNCRLTAPFLRRAEAHFRGREVVFMSISSDKSKAQWEKSVLGGQYVSPDNYNFYTEGMADSHPALVNYRIRAFPTFIVIDKAGHIHNVLTDPRDDNGRSLNDLITSLL